MGETPRTHIPRRKGERLDAYAALCDYAVMGPKRSLRKLWRVYVDQNETDSEQAPPTTNLRTIKRWSSRNDWQERVATYDETLQKLRREAEERALTEGLAKPARRVIELNKLYERLTRELERGRLWLDDVKQIGSGKDDTFEIVKIERFNSALIKHLRGLLDDVAQETGGRKRRMDLTTGDEPITDVTITVHPPRDGRLTETD